MNAARKHIEFVTGFAFLDGGPDPIYKFILDNGQGFTIGPETFAGKRGEPGACFENATNAALDDTALLYVEGFVTVYGVPIAHAWNVDRDGNLIDLTLAPARADGTMDRIGDYYGVVFSSHYLRKTIVKNKVYGLLDARNKSIAQLIAGKADWKPKPGPRSP